MWVASSKHGTEWTLRHRCSKWHSRISPIRLRGLKISWWRWVCWSRISLLFLSRGCITYFNALLTLGLLITFGIITVPFLRFSALLVAGALIALLGSAALV